jgi:hypothetical protein
MRRRPRKLEYFEDELKATPAGQEVLKVIRAHADEVMSLVNKNRPTMVCWNKHHGPVFIKSVVDSGFEQDVEFKKEVRGVTLETLILNMAEVLQDNGSPSLKSSIGRYIHPVLQMVRKSNNLREIFREINALNPPTYG